MKKILSFTIATAMLLSVVSCGKTEPEQYSVTASDGLDTYVRLFEERVEEKPDSFTILSGDDASAYGADVDHFVDDEGYTIRADDGEVVILSKTAAGADRAVRHFTVYGNYDNYSYTYGEDYKVRGLTVMGKPIEGFAVVCPDDSDAAMCYATEELVRYVSAATGTVLPVYTAADYAAAEDAPVNAITFSVDYDTHGDEAFTIDVKADGNIDIICGRYRGGIYGVYGLLRDMGWRFIYDGTEYLYESDGLDITEDCDRTEEAGIANRFASVTISDNKHGLHFGGNYDSEAVAKYGQYGIVQKACHGLQSEKINWKDSYEGFNGYSQPCYSDEKVIQAIEDHYRAYLDHRYATNVLF